MTAASYSVCFCFSDGPFSGYVCIFSHVIPLVISQVDQVHVKFILCHFTIEFSKLLTCHEARVFFWLMFQKTLWNERGNLMIVLQFPFPAAVGPCLHYRSGWTAGRESGGKISSHVTHRPVTVAVNRASGSYPQTCWLHPGCWVSCSDELPGILEPEAVSCTQWEKEDLPAFHSVYHDLEN